MKVLCLNDSMGNCPSFRARVLPFLPFLRKSGVEVECSTSVPKGTRADVVWVRRKLLLTEELNRLAGMPIVYDYDDAMYLSAEPFRRMMATARITLAGSERLVAEAKKAGAKDVVLLRTGADVNSYPVSRHNGPPVVLWTGSRTTVPYLETVAEPLRRLTADGVRIRVVADVRPQWDVPTEFVQWNQWNEKRAFEGASVGLAPLPDVPYAHGKCAFKIVQYMAAGLPVVASDIGANREMFERQGCRGTLVGSGGDFYEILSSLLMDREKRKAMGAENAMAARELDVSVLAPVLERELRRAAA